MGAGPSLSENTHDLIQEWYSGAESIPGLFEAHLVDTLLADETLPELSSPETGLSNKDIAELQAAVREGNAALDAGVRPQSATATVEHLLLELAVTCAAPAPHARTLQRRGILLRGLRTHLTRAAAAATAASSATPTAGACSPDSAAVGGSSTQWPAEYIATQQVRRAVRLENRTRRDFKFSRGLNLRAGRAVAADVDAERDPVGGRAGGRARGAGGDARGDGAAEAVCRLDRAAARAGGVRGGPRGRRRAGLLLLPPERPQRPRQGPAGAAMPLQARR